MLTVEAPADPDAVPTSLGVVGVRAVCDVHDRVGSTLRRLRRPARPAAALVRRVADPERVVAVEEDRDAFPVGLVLVVELVVEILEPVLDRDPSHGRLAHDVEVDGRARARCAKAPLDASIPRGVWARLGPADV